MKLHIKLLLRQLLRDKLYMAINVFGLAVGMGAFLMITMFVIDERSFDNFHENKERIIKLGSDGRFTGSFVYNPVSNRLKEQLSEVEKSSRFRLFPNVLIEANGKRDYEDGIAKVDADFLDIFSFRTDNQSSNPLLSPDNVVITQSIADKYFGEESAVGKLIKVDRNKTFVVAEVIKVSPANSSLQFSILLPVGEAKSPWFVPTDAYVMLRDGVSHEQFSDKLSGVEVSSLGIPGRLSESIKLTSMPFMDVHLHEVNGTSKANNYYVVVFFSIGIVILLIACVNYVNLTTAKSFHKIKEVGIRKALGASRSKLMLYFFFETLALTSMASLIAFALLERLMTYFESVIGRAFTIDILSVQVISTLVLVIIIVGFLSGFYPALRLSKFKPVKALKGDFKEKSTSQRSFLTGFQFVISLSMVMLTALVWHQVNFLKTSDLGFEKESKLVLKLEDGVGSWAEAFKNEIATIPGVRDVSYTAWVPGTYMTWGVTGKDIEGYAGDSDERVSFAYCISDVDFKETLGLRIAEGRWFSDDLETDKNSIVINKVASAFFNDEDPLGLKIKIEGEEMTIIGVVDDIKEQSLKSTTEPAIFRSGTGPLSRYALLDVAENFSDVELAKINQVWDEFIPEYPMSSYFLDAQLSRSFSKESGLNNLFNVFSLISILICLLGLLGLSAYMQERRKKEFSIHKVLGASMLRLMNLIVSSYVKIILLSLVLAIPVAYFLGKSWLQSFVYRFDFNLIGFALPVLVMIMICLAVSMFFIVKLAKVNPSETLRNE